MDTDRNPFFILTKTTLANLVRELAERQGNPIDVVAASLSAREASPRDQQSIAGLVCKKHKISPIRILGRCS